MIGSRPWQHTLWRLGTWLGLCALVGALAGAFWPALCAGLAIALGWHYRQLHRLLARLDSRRLLPPTQGWGVFSEVHERIYRRQREARRRKRRLHGLLRTFRSAADALPDAILVISSAEQRIEWFNLAAGRLLGLRRNTDVGKRFTHLVRSSRVAEWLQAGGAEPLLDLPSPANQALRLSLRLIDFTAGEKLLVVRDISLLTRLEQVRRDFVANVSHELRTPLTVMHGYLDMMDADEHPDWAQQIEVMRAQSLRMMRIVEDLLTLSRLDAQQRTDDETVPMRRMLLTLKREAQALSGERHEVDVEDLLDADLSGSPKELHSAFGNLVSNAVRHSPAGGRIVIRFAADADGSPRLSVHDSGPGIPARHLPRLTERFYRVSDSRSRDSGGTGLGLAIVKHILTLHQARLEIDSALGQGSVFACVFPPQRRLSRDKPADDTA
ncbi:MAG: phosphate regulon sensor histidine kinase PhoR [Lysobacteraceae bacterium]